MAGGGEQGRRNSGGKEAKDVGERKGKHREETLFGDEKRDQEVQARCFQEKVQSQSS